MVFEREGGGNAPIARRKEENEAPLRRPLETGGVVVAEKVGVGEGVAEAAVRRRDPRDERDERSKTFSSRGEVLRVVMPEVRAELVVVVVVAESVFFFSSRRSRISRL